jgi:hypothetical protein
MTITTVEQVVNMALDRIAYPEYVGNIWEGTKQARVALNIYGQTRDQLLRQFDWGFAEKIDAAVLVGPGPFPWANAFQYPADCIKLRSAFDQTYSNDTNDPHPVLYTVADSNPAAPSDAARVIYCNSNPLTLVYTMQVVQPAAWDQSFIEALVESLARRMPALLAAPDLMKAEVDNEKMATQVAETLIG